MFDGLSPRGTNVNVDPCNMGVGGTAQINNSDSETITSWQQAFSSLSSTELLAAFMPPSSFPLMKVISFLLFFFKKYYLVFII